MKNKEEEFKISNNYKDYKYEYTGYKEYIENLDMKKNDFIKNEEEIDHDHNYKFDFNNPNEHQHDYSFDFSQENNKEKYKPHDYSIKDDNKFFNQNNNISSSNNNISNDNNIFNNNSLFSNNQNKVSKIVIIVIFAYLAIFVLSVFIGFIAGVDTEDYEESSYYTDPIDAYCDALYENDYTILEEYISPAEQYALGNYNWIRILEKDYDYKNDICPVSSSVNLDSKELETLNDYYQTSYDTYDSIDDAYYVSIGNENANTYLIVGLIDDEWYLIFHSNKNLPA